MNEDDKIRLRVNRRDIVENVQTEEICHRLIAEGILNEDDDERIRAEKTSRDKAAALLNMLPKKGPNAYETFRDGLQQDPVYEWIIKKLDETDVSGIEHQGKPQQSSSGETSDNLSRNTRSLTDQNCDIMKNNKTMLECLSSPTAPVHIVKNAEPKSTPKYRIKITLVGRSFSGKTRLLDYLKNNRFNESLDDTTTCGVSFQLKVMPTNLGDARLELWDTAGQETFMEVSKSIARHSRCVVIVIDVTKKDSLDVALSWYNICKELGIHYCVFMCNKIDLTERVELDRETIENAIGDNPCFWVSAKTGENVNYAFSMTGLGAVVRSSAEVESTLVQSRINLPERERRRFCIIL